MKNLRYLSVKYILLACSIVWLLLVAITGIVSDSYEIDITNEKLKHISGCSYSWKIKQKPYFWPIIGFRGDSSSNNQASNLILKKNGKEFGTPHSLHSEIQLKGNGRYSHWKNRIIFSTNYCEKPKEQTYSISIKPTYTKATIIFSSLVILFLLTQLTKYLFSNENISKLSNSYNSNENYLLTFLGCASLILIAVINLLWIWKSGTSLNLSVGGHFQISDSLGYWTCANTLIDFGNFDEWCHRRSIYPTFLSGISFFSQQNIYYTLVFQAALLCTAIYLFASRAASITGIIGLIFSLVLLFRYAHFEAFTLTMTENAGMIFGCLGVATIILSTHKKSLLFSTIGIALISVALNARAGAFIVLPALILWAGICAYYFKKSIFRWIIFASIGVASGFALQSTLLISVGGDPSNSYGNFSYTLYGLSVGGKGWSHVMSEHPELFSSGHSDSQLSKEIYQLAFENLKKEPLLLIKGLYTNLQLYLERNTYGVSKLGSFGPIYLFAWWIAWIPILINLRSPIHLMTGLCSLAILASATILFIDGGPRVYAATVAIDTLQAAIGLSWFSSILATGFKSCFTRHKILTGSFKSISFPPETLFLILLILVFLTPIFFKGNIPNPPSNADSACNKDEILISSTIGKGTQLLNILHEAPNSRIMDNSLSIDEYIEGIPVNAWWHESDKNYSNLSFLVTYQQDENMNDAGDVYTIYSKINLQNYQNKKILLCIDKNNHINRYGNNYNKLNSITILE